MVGFSVTAEKKGKAESSPVEVETLEWLEVIEFGREELLEEAIDAGLLLKSKQ